ncbi:MAG: hypothetical protein WCW66_02785 [Patescibacteria group bacterium]
MIDSITTIIAFLTILTGVSGIFAISESIYSDEYSSKINNESQAKEYDEKSETSLSDNNSKSSDLIPSAYHISNPMLVSDFENNYIKLYSGRGIELSSQLLQSIKNSHIEGERAPPVTT